MSIILYNVHKPKHSTTGGQTEYDYSFFKEARKKKEGNFMVPLELIVRNTTPAGSSIFRRLDDGLIDLSYIGMDRRPQEGEILPYPIQDLSTKFEEDDRYPDIRKGESFESFLSVYGGLDGEEMTRVRQMLLIFNEVLTSGFERAGLTFDDGKTEYALNGRRHLVVVDAPGALDEVRATYNGVDLSKQMFRDFYRFKQPEWHQKVIQAQKTARETGVEDWRTIVTTQPIHMDPALIEMGGLVYASVCNSILRRQVFPSMPVIDEISEEYKRYREVEMKA